MANEECTDETKHFCIGCAADALAEARKSAESEGVALNQLITLARGKGFCHAHGRAI